MSMPFGQPSSGDWFKPAEANGHLVLITKVHEIGSRFDRLANAEKPHGVFDMVDLDAGGILQAHVNDSHPGIVNKLGKALRTGEMVLGRITQAASDKGNPAWILGPYAEGQDDARAMQWVNANPLNNFGQPAGQQAPPPPAPAPAPQAYAPAPTQQYAPPQQQYTPPTAPAPAQYAPAPAAPPHQYAPAPAAAPQPQPQVPAPGQQLDPNNLPPEVQQLLANLQNGGQQQPTA